MKRTVVLMTVCCMGLGVMADDWPQWRGPNGDGISMEKSWNPKAVSAGMVLWRNKVGVGYSGVAVVKENVFTMGNVGENDEVLCLNAADGSTVWKFAYPCGASKSYPGPRCTPAVDTGTSSVYVLSREGELYCLDAAKGTQKWKKDLKTEFGAQAPKWAFSSSPRVVGDVLLINEGERGIALNKVTGAKIWAGGPGTGGYSSPVVYKKGGKEFVAVFGAKNAYGVDLKTGAEVWSYPWTTQYDVNAADPIIIGDEVFISSGYGKGCALLDISGKVRPVWESKVIRSHFGSLVLKDGFIYGVDGQAGNKGAEIRCVEFKTGEQKWSEKSGFGAMSGANGMLLFLGEAGKLVVAQADPSGYKEIASAQLQLGGKCWTMPVLANGRIYCRSEGGDLLCVDVRK